MRYSYKDKFLFITCQLKYYIRKIKRKICSRIHLKKIEDVKRYGRKLSSINEVQNKIEKLILSEKPFMVGRLGGIEALNSTEAIKYEMRLTKKLNPRITKKAQINAGFFPITNDNIIKFSELVLDSMKQVDVLGSMPTNNEEFIVRKKLKEEALITEIGNLEPYYSNEPWTKALKGKKVLVISPFADSIQKQFKIKDRLYKDKNILPDFELNTVKAVQSIAGMKTPFNDWFEALDYMYNEAMKIDFDIAIIGCGAYGFPLAARLKQSGKQAIHLGGATQILFGVWGARWDNVENVRKLKNDFWIRPSKEETPENAKSVEDACYW